MMDIYFVKCTDGFFRRLDEDGFCIETPDGKSYKVGIDKYILSREGKLHKLINTSIKGGISIADKSGNYHYVSNKTINIDYIEDNNELESFSCACSIPLKEPSFNRMNSFIPTNYQSRHYNNLQYAPYTINNSLENTFSQNYENIDLKNDVKFNDCFLDRSSNPYEGCVESEGDMQDVFTSKITREFEEKLKKQGYYGVIYKITNIINLKVYIGQTTNFPKRWIEHKSNARRGVGTYLYNAIRKYATDAKGNLSDRLLEKNFRTEIIDYARTPEELNQKEIDYIESFKSYIYKYGPNYGYNMALGGEGGNVIEIDKDLLKELIVEGLTASEIARELSIGENTVYRRCHNFWNKSFAKIRRSWRKEIIYSLIGKGLNLNEIGDKLGMHRDTVGLKIKEYFNMDVYQLRNHFLKPILKSLIKKGYSGPTIAKKLDISRDTLNRKIREFWGSSLGVVRKQLIAPLLERQIKRGLSAADIGGKFGWTRQTVYKRVEDYLGRSLVNLRKLYDVEGLLKKKSIKKSKESRRAEIDRNILRELLAEGLSLTEIAKEFDVNRTTVSNRIREFWDLSAREAKERFTQESI